VAAVLGTFSFGAVMQFTYAEYGFHLLALYGFFSMSMFGAIYYIIPRLAGCEWLSARLIRQHFWYSTYGITTLVVCNLVGGLAQGSSINNPDNWDLPFKGAIENSGGYMVGRILAWVFILWSNLWFFLHLVLMVFGLGRRGVEPTLLETHHEPESEPKPAPISPPASTFA
jgi:cytochrome c oxidase cbb3-type subunit 1